MRIRHSPLLLRLTLLGVLLLGLAAALLQQAWSDYQAFADRPLAQAKRERVFEVERGDSFVHVLRRLRRIGVDDGHDWQWRALAWELGVLRRLQVGEYALFHGISPRELLLRLERGAVVQHRFTIIPGWNMLDLRRALASDPVLRQTLPELSDAGLMEQLGAVGQAPEGRFLPETYLFVRGISDVDILRRAHHAMRDALKRVWKKRHKGLPLRSAEEALILASIIEKETGRADERRDIAGVFVRRLQIGMRLQTDPTVIYGIGSGFDGNLTRRHLETDTPYNTYTRGGLPPTPIAMPSLAALRAAVEPAPGESLYFVARGDGSHQFSRTLSEHNAAVRRFQLKRR